MNLFLMRESVICEISHLILRSESPKELRFGVLEDLLQDIGFWSIIYVIFQHKKVLLSYWGP